MTPPSTFLDRLMKRDPLAGFLADLTRALNSRETGAALSLDSLSDIDINDPGVRRRLERRVRTLVLQHDPRIRRSRVKAYGQHGVIHLHITVYLESTNPICCEATGSARRWNVTMQEIRK